MKNKLFILFTIILAIGLLASCQTAEVSESVPQSSQNSTETGVTVEPVPVEVSETISLQTDQTTSVETVGFGSAGAFEDEDAEIAQMLVYAIQDEYVARAEYEYLIDELNAGTPFTNIIQAEVTHIEMLIPLFEAYGLEVPEDTSADHLLPAVSITEALETGVLAEINNIAMYDQFLLQDLPDDIRDAFTALRDASKNHLDAFQRKLDRS